MKSTLSPAEFVKSCQAARPTHHLFGWGSKELGEMGDAQMDEAAYLRCQVQLLTDEVERMRLAVMEREAIERAIGFCECTTSPLPTSNQIATLRALLDRTQTGGQ